MNSWLILGGDQVHTRARSDSPADPSVKQFCGWRVFCEKLTSPLALHHV